MLKITFEIVPGGDPVHPQRREIGHLNIGLQMKNDKLGQYLSMLTTDGQNEPAWRVIQVNHDRGDGPFELARSCLQAHLNQSIPSAYLPAGNFVSVAEALIEFDEDTRQ